MAAAAALVVILAVTVGRASWKHSNSGASLAALLGLIIGLFFIFAAGSPSGATTLASDAAHGVMALAVGLGRFIHAVPTA